MEYILEAYLELGFQLRKKQGGMSDKTSADSTSVIEIGGWLAIAILFRFFDASRETVALLLSAAHECTQVHYHASPTYDRLAHA